MRGIGISVALLIGLIGCTSEEVGSATAASGMEVTGCHVTAAGTLADGDRFAGVAHDHSNGPRGVWVHSGPRSGWDRDRLVGHIDSVVCEQNGALLLTLQGSGRFNGVDDHTFQVVVQDRQDPALTDTYRIVVVDPGGGLAYSAAGLFETGDVHSRHD